MQIVQSRRRFLASAAMAGTAGLVGASKSLHAEPPPETATVRIGKNPGICIAPQFVAEELLRAEGLTDIRYIQSETGLSSSLMLARDEMDFNIDFAIAFAIPIDAGEPIKVLAGMHVGCYEVFAHDPIRSIAELKGKRVGVEQLGSDPYVFLSVIATHVGLDPVNDIDWVWRGSVPPMQLFIDGKVDAFLAFPPEAQELRARNIGHVIVNSTLDRPWSQYFCCMLGSNAAYVERHPVATKRALRAFLKAADLCVAEPELVARRLVAGGYTGQYDYALQGIREVPYGTWREYDPEDTMRFFALRLHEAGLIHSSPQKIIADGTDWRFLDEIKRELKT